MISITISLFFHIFIIFFCFFICKIIFINKLFEVLENERMINFLFNSKLNDINESNLKIEELEIEKIKDIKLKIDNNFLEKNDQDEIKNLEIFDKNSLILNEKDEIFFYKKGSDSYKKEFKKNLK